MPEQEVEVGTVEPEGAVPRPTDAEMDQLIRACLHWQQQGVPLESDPAVQRYLARAANPKLALHRLRLFLNVGCEVAKKEDDTPRP